MSCPGSAFAAGVTLHDLSMKSTDSNWKPCLDTDKLIYKVIYLFLENLLAKEHMSGLMYTLVEKVLASWSRTGKNPHYENKIVASHTSVFVPFSVLSTCGC